MPNYITVSNLNAYEATVEKIDGQEYEITDKHSLQVDGYPAIEYVKVDPSTTAFAGEDIFIETSGYFITAWLDPVVQLSWSGDPEAVASTIINSLTLSKGL